MPKPSKPSKNGDVHLRVPLALYSRVVKNAETNRRTIPAEILVLLEGALVRK